MNAASRTSTFSPSTTCLVAGGKRRPRTSRMAVYLTPFTRSDARRVGYGSSDCARTWGGGGEGSGRGDGHGHGGEGVNGGKVARFRGVIPGFGITLGMTLLWLSLIV